MLLLPDIVAVAVLDDCVSAGCVNPGGDCVGAGSVREKLADAPKLP